MRSMVIFYPDMRGGVYRVSAGFLVVIAGLTAITGARTPIVPFKICPFLLATVAALFLLGSFI